MVASKHVDSRWIDSAETSVWADLSAQIPALLLKNAIAMRVNLRSTVVQIAAPFFFIALLFVLQLGLQLNEQRNEEVSFQKAAIPLNYSTLSRCTVGKGRDRCYTFGYTSSLDPNVVAVMQRIAADHQIPDAEVLPFRGIAEANSFLVANPNSTQGLFHLEFDYGCTAANQLCFADRNRSLADIRGVGYSLQINQTQSLSASGRVFDILVERSIPYQAAIENALLKVVGKLDLDINATISKMPHPEIGTTNVVASVGTTFFFASLCFNFVILLGTIVREKELHLREAFEVAGMVRNAYWISFAVTGLLQNFVSSLILILAGAIFQFDFFLLNDFPTYLLLFWLFSAALVALACFISAFVKQSRTAASIGFALVLVGFIVQFVAPAIFVEGTNQLYQILIKLTLLGNFAQGLSLLAKTSDSELDVGMRFSEIDDGYYSLADVYVWLMINCLIFSLLAWYLDHVLYFKRRPWFFVLPSFWCCASSAPVAPNPRKRSEAYPAEVEAERRATQQLIRAGDFGGVAIGGITKMFGNFCAVDDVYFSIAEGTITALLGHNGAGKSTLIRNLTGQWTPTSGDAIVYGHSLTSEMELVRRNLGLCPQHDILVDTLSPTQNIQLFCAFKRLSRSYARAEAARLLKVVDLSHVADKPSNQLSGGMQRRLSIAIALAGDPAIVLFDEPTAPIDIVSRRAIWNAIDELRPGRCILLCTHSMEEAETLADRIAIMKAGAIATHGSTLSLKRKYGDGVTITLTLDDPQQDAAVQRIASKLLQSDASGKLEMVRAADVLKLRVPPSNTSEQIAAFFDVLEREREPLTIIDMSVALASMEDVFIAIAEHGHAEPRTKPPSKAAVCCKKACPYISIVICVLLLVLAIGAAVATPPANTGKVLPTNITFWRDVEEPAKFDESKWDKAAFPWPVLVGDVSDTTATVIVRTPLERVALRVYRSSKTAWTYESALSVADVATVPPPSDAPGLLARPIANGNGSASGLVQRANLVPGAAQLVLAPLPDVAAGNFSRAFGVNATLAGGTCYLLAPLALNSILFAADACQTVPAGFAPKVRLLSALSAADAAVYSTVIVNNNFTLTLPAPGNLSAYFDFAPIPVSVALRRAADNSTLAPQTLQFAGQKVYTVLVRADLRLVLFDFAGESPASSAQARVTVLDGSLVDATPRQLLRADPPASGVVVPRTARFALTGLKSNDVYAVFAHAVGQQPTASNATRFRTADTRDARPKRTVFGATSALGPQNAPFPTLANAAAEKLDFMLLVGDVVYTAGLRSNADLRAAYSDVLNQTGLSELVRSTSVVALADDGELASGALGLAAFRDAMPVPPPEGNSTRLYRSLRFGSVHQLLIDVRSERNASAGRIMSTEQLDWLKRELSGSDAPFKLIVGGAPISNFTSLTCAGAASRWTSFPEQRDELLGHIRKNDIEGVVFVSSDALFSALYRLERVPTNVNVSLEDYVFVGDDESDLGTEMFEVLVGPAGSSILSDARFSFSLLAPSKQLLYTAPAWTYTRFTASEGEDGNLLTVDFIDDEGAFVFQRQLNVTERNTTLIDLNA
jgi:ABC-type multidrug transport system ATPase subunit